MNEDSCVHNCIYLHDGRCYASNPVTLNILYSDRNRDTIDIGNLIPSWTRPSTIYARTDICRKTFDDNVLLIHTRNYKNTIPIYLCHNCEYIEKGKYCASECLKFHSVLYDRNTFTLKCYECLKQSLEQPQFSPPTESSSIVKNDETTTTNTDYCVDSCIFRHKNGCYADIIEYKPDKLSKSTDGSKFLRSDNCKGCLDFNLIQAYAKKKRYPFCGLCPYLIKPDTGVPSCSEYDRDLLYPESVTTDCAIRSPLKCYECCSDESYKTKTSTDTKNVKTTTTKPKGDSIMSNVSDKFNVITSKGTEYAIVAAKIKAGSVAANVVATVLKNNKKVPFALRAAMDSDYGPILASAIGSLLLTYMKPGEEKYELIADSLGLYSATNIMNKFPIEEIVNSMVTSLDDVKDNISEKFNTPTDKLPPKSKKSNKEQKNDDSKDK